jgi:hypothetical protein
MNETINISQILPFSGIFLMFSKHSRFKTRKVIVKWKEKFNISKDSSNLRPHTRAAI